jgi:hypothetical protein
MLRANADLFTGAGDPTGCMLTRAVSTCPEDDPELQAYLDRSVEQRIHDVEVRLERGAADGEPLPCLDARALAEFLDAVVEGMAVRAMEGASRASLHRIVDITIAHLGHLITASASSACGSGVLAAEAVAVTVEAVRIRPDHGDGAGVDRSVPSAAVAVHVAHDRQARLVRRMAASAIVRRRCRDRCRCRTSSWPASLSPGSTPDRSPTHLLRRSWPAVVTLVTRRARSRVLPHVRSTRVTMSSTRP